MEFIYDLKDFVMIKVNNNYLTLLAPSHSPSIGDSIESGQDVAWLMIASKIYLSSGWMGGWVDKFDRIGRPIDINEVAASFWRCVRARAPMIWYDMMGGFVVKFLFIIIIIILIKNPLSKFPFLSFHSCNLPLPLYHHRAMQRNPELL